MEIILILALILVLVMLKSLRNRGGTKVDKDFYVSKEARKHIKKAKGSDN